MICVYQILHRGNEKTDVAPGKRHDSHRWTRPVYVRSRCPAEPEYSQGNAQAANHGRDKSILGWYLVRWVFGKLRSVKSNITEYNGHEAQDASYDYAGVDETGAFDAEVVDTLENVWHRREKAEQCREFKGDVETDEGHYRLGEEH